MAELGSAILASRGDVLPSKLREAAWKKFDFFQTSHHNQTLSPSSSMSPWEVTLVLAKQIELWRLRYGRFPSAKSPPTTSPNGGGECRDILRARDTQTPSCTPLGAPSYNMLIREYDCTSSAPLLVHLPAQNSSIVRALFRAKTAPRVAARSKARGFSAPSVLAHIAVS